MFKDLLEEYREDYGVPTDELSESETAEYLKYIELAQLKEQNEHLKAIREVVVWMASIALLFTAIGFLVCLLVFSKTSPVAGFVSFILMLVFIVLAAATFSYRNK